MIKNSLLFIGISVAIGCAVNNSASSGSTSSFTIGLISDLNASYGATYYPEEVSISLSKIFERKPQLLLCAGDMVAGQSRKLTNEDLQAMWRSFDTVVFQRIAKQKMPFGFTVGNHDASPSFLLDRAATISYWEKNKDQQNLQIVDDAFYPFYYSFLQQNVFVISWDASAGNLQPKMKEWLAEQLNSETAKNADWRILLGHLPLYAITEAKNKPGEVIADADSVLQTLKNLSVDLYISGHQHAYYTAQKEGMQLLNSGCVGNGQRPILGHHQEAIKTYSFIHLPKNKNKPIRVETYNAATHQPITHQQLPDSVQGFNGTIYKWKAQ